MTSQFGVICAGRPMQANFTPVDTSSTKFATEILNSEVVNHLVVLTFQPFPPGFGATVHIQLPDQPGWQLLGALTNDKPSAIFRLQGLRHGGGFRGVDDDIMTDTQNPGNPAAIGVSIEAIDSVQQQLSTLPSTRQSALSASSSMMSVTGSAGHSIDHTSLRMLQHLYNYVTSFAVRELPLNAHVAGQPVVTGAFGSSGMTAMTVTDSSWIPVRVFEQWFTTVKRKLNLDPAYFTRDMD